MEYQLMEHIHRDSVTSWTFSENTILRFSSLELVEETKESKNWKSIIIALVVIVIVLGLVITAILLVTPPYEEDKLLEKLSFKDFLEDKYKPNKVDPVWFSGDDAFIYRNSLGELILVNCTSNATSVFLSNSSFRELNTDTFKLSSDRRYVLFFYNIREKYTFTRQFFVKILNMRTKVWSPILMLQLQQIVDFNKIPVYYVKIRLFLDLYGPFGYDVQYATWSPTENTVIFVHKNNIYSRHVESEVIYYITDTGVEDLVYNGVPDWLYGERIFQSDNTIWTSPTGAYLVFAEIDDTHVKKYKSIVYGNPPNKYTTVTTQPYPKAGTKNPTIKLKLFDIAKNMTFTLPPPKDFRNRDHYVVLVHWLTADTVLVKWLNRPQNKTVITVCNAAKPSCRENFQYSSETGWIETPKRGVINSDGDEYFIILPQSHGSSGSYNQIASIDSRASHFPSNGRRLFLTNGKSEVTELVGYDRLNGTLFYMAVPENDTKTRHLYSINASRDRPLYQTPSCLSCDIKDHDYFDASFSRSGRFYVLGCLGPGIPNYKLYQTELEYVRDIESNEPLNNLLLKEMLPKAEYFHVSVPNSEEVLQVKLLLPPVYKTEELLKYNMLVTVGQDPGSYIATQEFQIGWEHVMSSLHSIIIAFIDTRRSRWKAQVWRQATQGNIGSFGIDDVLTATGHLKTLPFVHETSAVFGSEFGAYIVSSILTTEQHLLGCGLAVSPITDWRYMDSFYAERYLGYPNSSEYMNNYDDANISKYVSKNKIKKNLMLLHGTGDKRIHFQHTAQFMKTLSKYGIPFNSQIYPDASNLLIERSIKSHVYLTMEKFLLQCFGLPRGDEYHVTEEDAEEK